MRALEALGIHSAEAALRAGVSRRNSFSAAPSVSAHRNMGAPGRPPRVHLCSPEQKEFNKEELSLRNGASPLQPTRARSRGTQAGVSPARPRELAGAVGEGATPCTDGRPSENTPAWIASHQSSLPNAAKGYPPREPREPLVEFFLDSLQLAARMDGSYKELEMCSIPSARR